MDEDRRDEAVEAFQRAAAAAPAWGAPWYNLGLMYKTQRCWAESAACNRRATDLDPRNEAAWWNLGIAATALGDWRLARAAWRGFGVEMPDGDGPLELDYGPVPVRLRPEDDGEVVWADRLDPARAVIRSVPFPGSGFREGDIVLHDGEPQGTRQYAGDEYDVFDVLEVLRPSSRQTYVAWITAYDAAAVDALDRTAASSGAAVEDWTRTVHQVCHRCGGRPHTHELWNAAGWNPERHVGISAESLECASAVLLEWVSAGPSRALIALRPDDVPRRSR